MSNDISRITGAKPGATSGETRGANSARGGAGRAAQGGASAPGDASLDSVKLSPEASKIISLESKLKNLPDVDQARVERIRAAVANGQYHVDPQRVAQKFLALEGQL